MSSRPGTDNRLHAASPRAGFSDPVVAAAFSAYPKPLQTRLLALRRLILDTAKATDGVGASCATAWRWR